MKLKALIFDFDGLILDTELPEFQAWTEIYKAFDLELPIERWVEVIGSSFEVVGFHPFTFLQEKTGLDLNVSAIKESHRNHQQELLHRQEILPGVNAMIEAAKSNGLKLAVASSSPHDWVDNHLHRLGLYGHFEVITCKDDVENIKPEPDLYLSALSGLGVHADEAIVFEDSANGVTAANTAGIFTVAVPNTLTKYLDLNHASIQIDSLADITFDQLVNNFHQNESRSNAQR